MARFDDLVRSDTLRNLDVTGRLVVRADLPGSGWTVLSESDVSGRQPCVAKASGPGVLIDVSAFGFPDARFNLLLMARHLSGDVAGRPRVDWDVSLPAPAMSVIMGRRVNFTSASGRLASVLHDTPPEENAECPPRAARLFHGGISGVPDTNTITLRGGAPQPFGEPVNFEAVISNLGVNATYGQTIPPGPRVLRIELRAPNCQQGTEEVVAGEVVLTGVVPAEPSGAPRQMRIELTVEPASLTLQPPSPLSISSWHSRRRFDVILPPQYAGPVRVTAAAASGRPSAAIEVRPVDRQLLHLACFDHPAFYVADVWSNPLIPQLDLCPECRVMLISDRGDIAGYRGGSAFFLRPGSAPEWFGDQLEGSVRLAGIDRAGNVVGSVKTEHGKEEGFILQRLDKHPSGTLKWLEMVPVTMNTVGDMAGYTVSDGNPVPVVMIEGELRPLKGIGHSPMPIAITDTGVVLGRANDAGGLIYGFVETLGEVRELRLPDVASTVPTAINRAGVVVGFSSDGEKRYWPFALSPNGEPLKIAVPDGFSAGVATDVNNDGVVVGTAFEAQEESGRSCGFIFTDGTGAVDLNALVVGAGSGMNIVATAAVTGAGEIVATSHLGDRRVDLLLRPVPGEG